MTMPHLKRNAELKSSCQSGKRRYRSEDRAQRALQATLGRAADGEAQRHEQRVYECHLCQGFHLTSKPYEWQRTTPIRPVSADRAKEQAQRTRMLRNTYGTNPTCARCGKPADDAHELLSRARGGSITDPANITPLCRPCHSWITTEPRLAEAEGWALPTPPARNLEGCS